MWIIIVKFVIFEVSKTQDTQLSLHFVDTSRFYFKPSLTIQMAFRAFRSNPAIGGFSEGLSTDIFPQVLKELVDNAVDACRDVNDGDIRRVRVNIQNEKFVIPQDATNDMSITVPKTQEVLRITVTDNGCGMEDIEKCVCPFESNKTLRQDSSCPQDFNQTAGRYGIGLTLCMLHAQRLVPHSHTTIKSAIASSSTWTSIKCVVDSEHDVVNIIDKRKLPKDEHKSGTAICIVVPGGERTKKAWPRLAEYFARFHLSNGIKCSLEVLAPFFSNVPLFIRPPVETVLKNQKLTNSLPDEKEGSSDFNEFVDINDIIGNHNPNRQSGHNDEENSQMRNKSPLLKNAEDAIFTDRINITKIRNSSLKREDASIQRKNEMRSAFSSYLKTDIDIKNIAHSCQIIRRSTKGTAVDSQSNSTLEVDVVICQRSHEDFFNNADKEEEEEEKQHERHYDSNMKTRDSCQKAPEDCSNAKLMVIRMVNRIPLLDSDEAFACGVVRGVTRGFLWNTIGLEISTDETSSMERLNLHAPTFSLKDSSHVAPFLTGKTNHSVYKFESSDGYLSSDADSQSENLDQQDKKRKRNQVVLHPVGIRMGNVYILVQLNAEPTELPLPTLSKGRLPMNDEAIDKALQSGILSCFRSLQQTNPELFLSSTQLKQTELNSMYIPAFSQGISSMIVTCSDQSLKARMLKLTQTEFKRNEIVSKNISLSEADEDNSYESSISESSKHVFEAKLSDTIENRIRLAFAYKEEEKLRKNEQKRRMMRRATTSIKNTGEMCDADSVLFQEEAYIPT